MEREILIANTKTQKRSKITTSATTLGELKTDLRAAGIDFSGMTFTEGISKTQLLSDDTQLPQNVIYKGQPTNNLVILLTNTKKNIASGVLSRQEIKDIIKHNNLQEAIKNKFGRNYTQVSSKNLELFIDSGKWCEQKKKAETPKTEGAKTNAKEETTVPSGNASDISNVDNKNNVDKEANVVNENNTSNESNIPTVQASAIVDSLFTHISTLVVKGVLIIPDLHMLEKDIHKLIISKGDIVADTSNQAQCVTTPNNLIDDDDIDDIIDDLGL